MIKLELTLKLLRYLPLISFLTSCVPVGSSSADNYVKILHTEDRNYEKSVGLVQVFSKNSKDSQIELGNPVLREENKAFFLRFDLFQESFTSVTARYVHCQADWSPSNLADSRFLATHNEFPIGDFGYSSNTKSAYVTYSAELPTPNVSGNYILCVYKDYDPKDLLFTRRFLVVDDLVEVSPKLRISSSVALRTTHQQIDFSISYSQMSESINPLRDFRMVILRNHQWEGAIRGLQPTLIRQHESYLEYFHQNQENNHWAGNEFRFFDLRSIEYRGQHVASITKEEDRIVAFISKDKALRNSAYSQLNDLNGDFYLENRDPGNSQGRSEYVWVHFQLEADQVNGDVYVVGKFNNWRLDATSRMVFDTETATYRGKHFLKQGYYNYAYVVKSDQLPPSWFEGDFFQTSNEYEIIVYHRDPLKMIDRIVGYQLFSGRL